MKTKFKLLAVLGLVAFTAATAQAQFVQGPALFSAVTNASTWAILPAAGGGVSTNVPTGQARWCPVGQNGFGVLVKAYATNAALTTNVWFTLETTTDGINANSNTVYTVAFLPNGVATNTYYTNIVATTANVGNIAAVRIKDVMQTNGLVGSSLAGRLFVEKFIISTR